jgi:uncharacterized protein
MSLKQKLESALLDALRKKDAVEKRTIRMALSNIKLAEVEKGDQLDDNALLAIIQKELKMRQEAIQDAEKANRPDLIKSNQEEIEVLKHFLPKQLSDEELFHLIQSTIHEVGATNMTDMGKVMKVLIPRLEGRASGNQASLIVRQQLQDK